LAIQTATGGYLKVDKGRVLTTTTTNNFDFLLEPSTPTPEYTPPEHVGPNLKSAVQMTPKKFANAVLDVFDALGGASWLMTQAKADPKSFLDLLKRMIPKSVQLDDLQGIKINLIDQFGTEVQIQTQRDTATPLEPGQLQIATGGSPPSDPASSTGQKETHTDKKTQDFDFNIDIKDTFV